MTTKNTTGKEFVKKAEDIDPNHYSMLPSENDVPFIGLNSNKGKKRVWLKDGAVIVDKTDQI